MNTNSNVICKNVQCTSYSEEDGCTVDTYAFTFMVEEGRFIIRHEISCGLMGNQLFCGPPIDTNYGIPIPEYMIQLANMVLETNDFKTEPRYKTDAVENFISWFDTAMKQIVKEKREVRLNLERLSNENAVLEKELKEMYKAERKYMSTSVGLLGLLHK